MVKKELCEVVEVRRASDIAMAVVLLFVEDVLRLICGHAPPWIKLGRKTVFL